MSRVPSFRHQTSPTPIALPEHPPAASPPATGADPPLRAVYPAAITGLTLLVLGIDHGGTGRGAWVVASASFAAAGAAVAAGWARPSRLALGWLALLTTLTGWVALSAAWSAVPSVALLEANRALVYLGLATLVALAAGADLRLVPHAVMVSATLVCLDSIALRAFPGFPGSSPLLGYGRLYEPVGYWNALGILAAMGALVALQIAIGDPRKPWRIAASACLPITVPVMYLTFSRGAVIAFAAGVLICALVARRRLDWLVCAVANAVPAGIVVLVVAHQPDLVAGQGTGGAGGLVAAVAFGVAAAIPVAVGLDARPAAVRTARLSRRAALAVAASAVIAGALLFVVAVGSPAAAVHRASAGFSREVWFNRDLHGNLNNRYLELSLSGRVTLWDGAVRLGRSHPLAGAGAGSFGRYWQGQNQYPKLNREALSLYLETFAELGAVGVLLLAGVLLLPLWRAARARSEADLVLGAFVAFVLHAAQDMDWEWPVTTATAVVCAALVVGRAQSRSEGVLLSPAARWALGGACVTAAVVAVSVSAVATGWL